MKNFVRAKFIFMRFALYIISAQLYFNKCTQLVEKRIGQCRIIFKNQNYLGIKIKISRKIRGSEKVIKFY